MMLDLVGGQPDEAPEMYDLASPIYHISVASPPTLLFQGETVHGFDLLFPRLAPAGQAALYYLERFLACVVMEDGLRMPPPQPAASQYR
jgi:hypothetical protein